MVGALAILGNLYFTGKIELMYGLIFLGYFLVFYIIQLVSNKLEETVLLALNIKEPDKYNAEFLLTQKHVVGNILAIKENVLENQ